MTDYKKYINVVADFPKDGIFFKDISPLLANDEIFKGVIGDMGRLVKNPKYWVGVDARGFIFASVLAHRTRGPLVLARKPGKLPGKVAEKEYDLEYGTNKLQIQADSIEAGDRCLIIDDLMATGGTMCAVLDLVEELNAFTVAVATVIDLPKLGGADKVRARGIPFYAGVQY